MATSSLSVVAQSQPDEVCDFQTTASYIASLTPNTFGWPTCPDRVGILAGFACLPQAGTSASSRWLRVMNGEVFPSSLSNF